MSRQIRMVAYSNDAYALAISNFHLPIYKWKATSQSKNSVSELLKDTTWQIRVKNISELVGLKPKEVYTTLPERLSGLPKGYTWKLEEAICLYEQEEEVHLLRFVRDTIHKSYSTEEDYQSFIYSAINDSVSVIFSPIFNSSFK